MQVDNNLSDNIISVRNIHIGEDLPKICVPVVVRTIEELHEELAHIMEKEPDMIELRADYLIDSGTITYDRNDYNAVSKILHGVRERINDKILLFTIRTLNEGGKAHIEMDAYVGLCKAACESGCIDLIDVEAFIQEGVLAKISGIAHDNNVFVVGSNHDFDKTPDEDEIIRRLIYMSNNGADIPKIAVMPMNEEDVMILMSATLKYKSLGMGKPIITMSMGGTGVVSRLVGEMCGSCVTFAAVGQTSAPGQIPIEDVRYILNVLHKYQSCRRND